MVDEILVWSWPNVKGYMEGTLKEYITLHYPCYAKHGLFTWEEILQFTQKEKDNAK